MLEYVEPQLIQQYQSHVTQHGYNLKKELCGTNYNSAYGIKDGRFRPRTQKEKELISIGVKNALENPEVKQNIRDGIKKYYINGGIPPMQGKKHSLESIQKMSETTKAMVTDQQREQTRQMSLEQWRNPEKREQIIKHLQHPSKETRKKMSDAKIGKTTWNKGLTHSKESIEKMRRIKLGKIMSPETKKKLSIKRTLYLTEDRRKELSNKMKGHHNLTDESKRKIGDATRKYLFQVTHPNGKIEIITSLKLFCDSVGLNDATARVASKFGKTTKTGYKFEQISKL